MVDEGFDRVNKITLKSLGHERKRVKDERAHKFVACIDEIGWIFDIK